MSSFWQDLDCPSYNGYLYCSGMGPPTCNTCTSAYCGFGKERSFDCSTQPLSNMANPVCQGCRPGTENPLNDGEPCTACNTGFFTSAIGTVNCQACTNKPFGAAYAAWGSTPATENACPWVCDVGFYLGAGGRCVGCPAGVYKLFANNLTSCGVACTNANAISNSYYVQAAAGGSSSSCPWCVCVSCALVFGLASVA